jgi:uncharacterized protein
MTAELASDGYPIDAMREFPHSVRDLATSLADRIEQHCADTGEQFDKIIVIPRGSYDPANIMVRRFGFTAVDLIHMCMSSYKDGQMKRNGVFEYGQMPTPEEVDGLDLLIIEEVCDTGETLKHATELLALANAGLIRTATLHYKPTKSTTGFVPDWYGIKTDAWIVYPWEKDEKVGASSAVKRRPPEPGTSSAQISSVSLEMPLLHLALAE